MCGAFEACYTKVLMSEEDLIRPDPNNLTPRARALFDVVFPSQSALISQKEAGSNL